ncbi:MAG: hypothetical protein ACFFDI_29530, partial [Promethearchaeota archaeon]
HFEGWPYPRFYRPFEPLNPPKKLEGKINWKTYPLSKDEIKTKYEALKAHKTQFVSNSKYLLSFIKMNELFGGYDMLLANECCSTRQIEEGCIRSIVPVGEISEDEHSEDEQSVYHAIKETSICLVNDILTLSINLSSVNGKKLDIGRKMECKDIDGGRTIREGVLPLKQKSFFPPIHGCGASFHIFSYRNDRPFETMPKVQITVHRNYYSIFGLAEIPEPVEVVREASKLTVNVPLRLLKNPHKILINVRKFIGTVTLQLCFLSRRCFWIPWRIIGIE